MLLDMGLGPNTNPATRAIGYRQALEWLAAVHAQADAAGTATAAAASTAGAAAEQEAEGSEGKTAAAAGSSTGSGGAAAAAELLSEKGAVSASPFVCLWSSVYGWGLCQAVCLKGIGGGGGEAHYNKESN